MYVSDVIGLTNEDAGKKKLFAETCEDTKNIQTLQTNYDD